MVDVRRTPCRTLAVLVEPLREQHADAALTEIDSPCVTTGRLGWSELDAAVLAAAAGARLGLSVDLHELLPYYKESTISIYI